jgi:tripartite-type tricarboxylate transporter receptor subunit TctC
MCNRSARAQCAHYLLIVAVTLALFASPLAARSDSYPDKPIRFIVPSPPGGGTDTLTRLVATKLSETLGWQIVVENKPGAGGNIGMDLVAKAPADGYAIVMGESSNLTINPSLYAHMPFDPAQDLTPVVLVGTVPLVLVAAPARQLDSVSAIVEHAKARTLSMASGGNGTVGHLAGVIWMQAAGVTFKHVAYRGGAAAIADVLGGQVDINFASIPAAAALIESGKLRALAVTSLARTPQFPDVPTLGESGYGGFSAQVIYGVLAPAGMPAPILQTLNTEINRVLKVPDLERLKPIGVTAGGGTAEDFGALIAQEREKWSRAVAASGARVE